MPDTLAIHTDHLTKYYGAVRGLESLTLEVPSTEIFGFLGPNGAGKTTTIRLLMDFIRPTAGQASVLGLDSRRDSQNIRRRVGYLSGDMTLYGKMTGKQLLVYLASLRGGVDWKFVSELVDRLESDLYRPIQSLSRGNKQKVGLIQAFMNRPDLIIMDEPTTGLDPLIQQEFYQMVDEVKADGRTAFMSSHNIAEVERICDRVGIIREGALVAIEMVQTMKDQALYKFEVHFSTEIPEESFNDLQGVQDLEVQQNILRCTIKGKPDALIRSVARFEILRLVTYEPSLEDIFLSYYGEGRHNAT
jgi:ABC-2 type transport system ATP-binding protein